jgi:hypothetical protein
MPNNQRPGGQPPSPRRDRREATRRDRNLAAARTAAPRPAWQSPMLLLSVGAVAVGLVVILLASGVLGRNGSSTGELLIPIQPTPPELVDRQPPRARQVSAPVTIEVQLTSSARLRHLHPGDRADLIKEFVRLHGPLRLPRQRILDQTRNGPT